MKKLFTVLLSFSFLMVVQAQYHDDCDDSLKAKWPQYCHDFSIYRECAYQNFHPIDLLAVGCPIQIIDAINNHQIDTVGDAGYIAYKIISALKREVILARTIWNLEHLTFSDGDGTVPDFYKIAKTILDPSWQYEPEKLGNRPRPAHPRLCYRDAGDQQQGVCSSSLAHTLTHAAEEPKTCILCDGFYSSNTTPLNRAMVLVHEARHRWDEDPGHNGCPTGNYVDKRDDALNDNCDQRLEAEPDKNGSGFNASVYFLYWVAYNQTSNIFDRNEAKALLKDMLTNRFVEKPTEEQLRKYIKR